MHAVAGSSFCLCSKVTRTYRTLTRKFPLLSLILPPLKSSPCKVISFNLGHCLMFPGPCSEMENHCCLPKGLPCGCQSCCVLAQGSLMPQSVHVLHSQTHELPKKVLSDHLHKDPSTLIRFLIFNIILSWCCAPVPQISGLSEWCPTNELIQIILKSQIIFKTIQSAWVCGGINAGPETKLSFALCCFQMN